MVEGEGLGGGGTDLFQVVVFNNNKNETKPIESFTFFRGNEMATTGRRGEGNQSVSFAKSKSQLPYAFASVQMG